MHWLPDTEEIDPEWHHSGKALEIVRSPSCIACWEEMDFAFISKPQVSTLLLRDQQLHSGKQKSVLTACWGRVEGSHRKKTPCVVHGGVCLRECGWAVKPSGAPETDHIRTPKGPWDPENHSSGDASWMQLRVPSQSQNHSCSHLREGAPRGVEKSLGVPQKAERDEKPQLLPPSCPPLSHQNLHCPDQPAKCCAKFSPWRTQGVRESQGGPGQGRAGRLPISSQLLKVFLLAEGWQGSHCPFKPESRLILTLDDQHSLNRAADGGSPKDPPLPSGLCLWLKQLIWASSGHRHSDTLPLPSTVVCILRERMSISTHPSTSP